MSEKVTVVRGPDWKWDNQDGGEGSTGTVVKVFRGSSSAGEKGSTVPKTAAVRWASGSANVYRVGAESSYDLRILDNSKAGVKHEGTKCDACNELNFSGLRWNCVECSEYNLCTKCYMSDKHNLNHEFWRIQTVGGKRVRVPKRRNATKIQQKTAPAQSSIAMFFKRLFGRSGPSYYRDHLPVFESAPFEVGDKVLIDSDVEKVKSRQNGHGGWEDSMAKSCGKTGKVIRVDADGDLTVIVDGKLWMFNPCSVERVTGSESEISDIGEAFSGVLSGILGLGMIRSLLENASDSSDDSSSDDSSSGNDSKKYETLIEKHKEMINEANSEGDTPLHVAATCDNASAAEALLKHGAEKNIVNNQGYTALHLAVKHSSTKCAKLLLDYGCNLDKPDSDGNTAFHIAINEKKSQLVEMFVSHKETNFKLRNRQGYNVFHQAALIGYIFAVEAIMRESPSIVDVGTDDDDTALHLSVRGGHFDVTEMLIKQGKCEVNVCNRMNETPLLVAAKLGRCAEVELLVFFSADIHAEDKSGNTALHLALLNQRIDDKIDLTNAPATSRILAQIGKTSEIEKTCGLGIACFLAQKGCRLRQKNRLEKSAIDYVNSTVVRDILCNFAGEELEFEPVKLISKPEEKPIEGECIVCCRVLVLICFKPCGHEVVCKDCSVRMKKCIVCREEVTK